MGLVQPLPAQVAKIKVVGIGGAGTNAINHMSQEDNIQGVDFVAINTDAQSLLVSQAKIKIQIGEKLTKGLGSGGNPEIGQKAAEESKEKIKKVLEGADMVFIATGAGGGTGTGASPIIAEIAKNELKALTVAVVTKPFLFEGTKRMVIAEEGIENLKQTTDTLITIPNQKLLEMTNKELTFLEAFKTVDSVLSRAVKGIAEIITTPGLINLDFADIKAIMQNAGSALMGIGFGSGENRVQEAVQEAINSPLLDLSIKGARGILFNITGGNDLSMTEVKQIAELISQNAGGDANIIFGANIDDSFKDQVKITLIATGFDDQKLTLAGLMKSKPLEKVIFDPKEATKKQILKIKQPIKGKKEDLFKSIPIDKDDLPEGVEIEDQFDIPAFLRRNQ